MFLVHSPIQVVRPKARTIHIWYEKKFCMCLIVQQKPVDTPYSSQLLRKLELYIGNPVSHPFGELDMDQF